MAGGDVISEHILSALIGKIVKYMLTGAVTCLTSISIGLIGGCTGISTHWNSTYCWCSYRVCEMKKKWTHLTTISYTKKRSLDFNFRYILLMENLLNSTYYYTFTNLSMMAYIIEIQNSKYLILWFDQSEPGCQIKFCVYSHFVG